MNDAINIKHQDSNALPALHAMYKRSFTDQDLTSLLNDLDDFSDAVQFTATMDEKIVGHIALTKCDLESDPHKVALIGPLAVDPDFFKQGIGSALMRHGMNFMQTKGVSHVLLLGAPAYYGRFGFTREDIIAPPYPLKPEWLEDWQGLALSGEPITSATTMIAPSPWHDPALWQ